MRCTNLEEPISEIDCSYTLIRKPMAVEDLGTTQSNPLGNRARQT